MCRVIRFSALFLIVVFVSAQSQNVWELPKKQATIVVDGNLQEWSAIPGLELKLGAPGVRTESMTQPDDASALLKGVWDVDNLYLALEWKDNIWDVQPVPRQQAIWVTPERQRRERALFFDYFKFNIHDIQYDYLLWTSPRIEGQGPFFWDRFLEGAKRMERASSPPAINGRQADGTATLEILLKWRDVKVNPKAGQTFPLGLFLCDGDGPGLPLELKLPQVKNLQWDGVLRLGK